VLEHMPMSATAYGVDGKESTSPRRQAHWGRGLGALSTPGAVPRIIALGPKLPRRMYISVVIRGENRETYDSKYLRLQHVVDK